MHLKKREDSGFREASRSCGNSGSKSSLPGPGIGHSALVVWSKWGAPGRGSDLWCMENFWESCLCTLQEGCENKTVIYILKKSSTVITKQKGIHPKIRGRMCFLKLLTLGAEHHGDVCCREIPCLFTRGEDLLVTHTKSESSGSDIWADRTSPESELVDGKLRFTPTQFGFTVGNLNCCAGCLLLLSCLLWSKPWEKQPGPD